MDYKVKQDEANEPAKVNLPKLTVKVKKLNPNAILPFYSHENEDMCCDLTAVDYHYDAVYDNYVYHTGLAFEIPVGYGMLLFPRSSNNKTEAYMTNHVGIIDSGYRGEVLVHFKNRQRNMSKPPYRVGDRIAQIAIIPYPIIEFLEANELAPSKRGEGGHGSTGK